jgi:hypothetical protein
LEKEKKIDTKRLKKTAGILVGLLAVGVLLLVFVLQPALMPQEQKPIDTADGTTWRSLNFRGAFRKLSGKSVNDSGEVAPAEPQPDEPQSADH